MTGNVPQSTEEARVLIVEDEARLRNVLASAIPEMGFQANAVVSATDAIRIMDDDPHDIVVLDLSLPGMNGLEFFRILHDRWPDTQVVILTGFGDLEAAQQAIRLGVVDFLTKPASLGDLEIALDRAYRRKARSTEPHQAAFTPQSAEATEIHGNSPHSLRELQRDLILAALARNHGNRAATAAELGISLRTLYYRLAEYQRQGFTT